MKPITEICSDLKKLQTLSWVSLMPSTVHNLPFVIIHSADVVRTKTCKIWLSQESWIKTFFSYDLWGWNMPNELLLLPRRRFAGMLGALNSAVHNNRQRSAKQSFVSIYYDYSQDCHKTSWAISRIFPSSHNLLASYISGTERKGHTSKQFLGNYQALTARNVQATPIQSPSLLSSTLMDWRSSTFVVSRTSNMNFISEIGGIYAKQTVCHRALWSVSIRKPNCNRQAEQKRQWHQRNILILALCRRSNMLFMQLKFSPRVRVFAPQMNFREG